MSSKNSFVSSDPSLKETIPLTSARIGEDNVNWVLSLSLEELLGYASLYCEVSFSRIRHHDVSHVCLHDKHWVTLKYSGVVYWNAADTALEALQCVILQAMQHKYIAARILQFKPDVVTTPVNL